MKIEIDSTQLNIPEGWEATGEFRPAVKGEAYISDSNPGIAMEWRGEKCTATPKFIVRKRKQWRPMKWDDIATILKGPFDVRVPYDFPLIAEGKAFGFNWSRVNGKPQVSVELSVVGGSTFKVYDITDVQVLA